MSWNGVKKQSHEQEIKSWCEEMDIENYIINSKCEIDVDGNVGLFNKDLKELPYKFGTVTGYFNVYGCQNLTSLKNCPNKVGKYFACNHCPQLDSLEGCPKKVGSNFYCVGCKRDFSKEEVESLCKVKRSVLKVKSKNIQYY